MAFLIILYIWACHDTPLLKSKLLALYIYVFKFKFHSRNRWAHTHAPSNVYTDSVDVWSKVASQTVKRPYLLLHSKTSCLEKTLAKCFKTVPNILYQQHLPSKIFAILYIIYSTQKFFEARIVSSKIVNLTVLGLDTRVKINMHKMMEVNELSHQLILIKIIKKKKKKTLLKLHVFFSSKFSFLFHLKNYHSKNVNFKFGKPFGCTKQFYLSQLPTWHITV